MCRIVGFIGSNSGVGTTTICYELSKRLNKKGFKVCVFDTYFSFNDLALKFKTNEFCDLKNYLIGKAGLENILGNFENVSIVKTNVLGFDYLRYSDDIKRIVEMLSFDYDFIIIDINIFDQRILKFTLGLVSEIFVVFDNQNSSIFNTKRLSKVIGLNKKIEQVNYILSRSKILGQIRKQYLNKSEIESVISSEIIFEIPLLNKYFVEQKKFKINKKNHVFDNFVKSFLSNKICHINYAKKYRGLIGFFRRKIDCKFE